MENQQNNFNCGIVILNYNTFDDTCECVKSIYQNENLINMHIYIVDNNSPDNSCALLNKQYKNDNNITIISSDRNLGFSGGNNLGIRMAIKDKKDYIFLLNSDVILLNSSINKMCKALDEDENIVSVGPSITNLNGEYAQYAKKGLTTKSFILDKKIIRSIFKNKSYNNRFFFYDINSDFFVFDGMVSGCCMGFKTDFVKKYNLLDDNVFMYYEEDILAHIILKNKLKTVICNEARIIHKEGASVNKKNKEKLCFTRYHRWISSFYVLKKYANSNCVFINFLFLIYCLVWSVFSVFSKKYSVKRRSFISKLSQIKKM